MSEILVRALEESGFAFVVTQGLKVQKIAYIQLG
jgi:hypothetical protein